MSSMGVLDVVASSTSPRSLAVSISLSYLILSYLFLGTYIPRSPTLYSSAAHRMYRGQSYVSRVIHYPPREPVALENRFTAAEERERSNERHRGR